jgi:hypothetical protein
MTDSPAGCPRLLVAFGDEGDEHGHQDEVDEEDDCWGRAVKTTFTECKQKLYRVGPNCETWPNTLTEIPIRALKLARNLGQPCTIFFWGQNCELTEPEHARAEEVVRVLERICPGRNAPKNAVKGPVRPY